MSKTSPEAEVLIEYAFPELGVTVKAKDLATATKMAHNHPDVVYKDTNPTEAPEVPAPAAK